MDQDGLPPENADYLKRFGYLRDSARNGWTRPRDAYGRSGFVPDEIARGDLARLKAHIAELAKRPL